MGDGGYRSEDFDFFGSLGKPSRDLGEGDRRGFERHVSDKACSAQYGDAQVESQLRDVSVTDAWIESRIDVPAGTEVDVVILSIDRSFEAEVVRVDDGATRIRFLLDEGDSEALGALETFITLTKVEGGDTLE